MWVGLLFSKWWLRDPGCFHLIACHLEHTSSLQKGRQVWKHGIVLNVMFEVGIHHFPPIFSWVKPNHIGSPKCKNVRNKRCVWMLGEQLWPPLQGLHVISSDVKNHLIYYCQEREHWSWLWIGDFLEVGKTCVPGFGDLFRKAAMLHHLGNLMSVYPSPCFYKRQMATEEDDVLFYFVFFQGRCFQGYILANLP